MLVGRVPSRGALLAFPSECEISRLAPLAGQGESGPEVWVLEFVGVEQGQLRFPPRLRTRLAGAPAPDEFRHQLALSLNDLPQRQICVMRAHTPEATLP